METSSNFSAMRNTSLPMALEKQPISPEEEASADSQLQDLLTRAVRSQHCVYNEGKFSNHMTMALTALDLLCVAGGVMSQYKRGELLNALFDKYKQDLWPIRTITQRKSYLLDYKLPNELVGAGADAYEQLLSIVEKQIVKDETEPSLPKKGMCGGSDTLIVRESDLVWSSCCEVMNTNLMENEEIIPRVSGFLFHPMIQLAYACLSRNKNALASALAFWSCAEPNKALSSIEQRSVGPIGHHEHVKGDLWSDQENCVLRVVELLMRGVCQEHKDAMRTSHDGLHGVAQNVDMEYLHELMKRCWNGDVEQVKTSAARVLRDCSAAVLRLLVLAGSDDIVALHAVTAVHAARVLSEFLDPQPLRILSVSIWESVVLFMLKYGIESAADLQQKYTAAYEQQDLAEVRLKSWRDICCAATYHTDVHDLKLVFTSFDEARHRPEDEDLYKLVAVRRLHTNSIA